MKQERWPLPMHSTPMTDLISQTSVSMLQIVGGYAVLAITYLALCAITLRRRLLDVRAVRANY